MYRTIYRLATTLAYALPLSTSTLRASLAGRRAALEGWCAWARRGGEGPLLWVHGASVGELTAAEPVIRRLLRDDPTLRAIATYSSPSTTTWRPPPQLSRAGYVPPDRPPDLARVLDALRPALMLFSRGDLWPELIRAAHARCIPIAIAGATVRPASARLRWPARSLYAGAVRAVSWLGAVTADDAARWTRLGVPPDRVVVTGDPRHDAILERVPDLAPLAALREWRGTDRTVIAGSAESDDRRMLLEAARTILAADRTVRVLVVPHRTETQTVAAWRRAAWSVGLEAGVWQPGRPADSATRIMLVAAQGLLADLYALGDVAYVGGGFRRRGLHAVAEPAAWALPVTVGPHWRDTADARALVAAGGAIALPHRDRAGALARAWSAWLADEGRRMEAGLAARRVLTRGAARRTVEALRRLVTSA